LSLKKAYVIFGISLFLLGERESESRCGLNILGNIVI